MERYTRSMAPPIVWLTIVFEGGLLLAALGIGALSGTPPFATLSIAGGGWLVGLLATLPLLALLDWSLRTRWKPLARLRSTVFELVVPMLGDCSAPHLLAIAVAAGIGEESLFRGVLQPLAERFVPTAAALVAVSLLFGLCHAVNLTYAVIAALIGLYLGSLLLVTDNLLVPILVHALYDFVALRALLRRAPGDGSGSSEVEAAA